MSRLTRLIATMGAMLMLMFGAVAMPSVAHAAVPGKYYSCAPTSYNGYGTVRAGRTYADLAMANTNTSWPQAKEAHLSLYSSSGNYLWSLGTAYNVPSSPKRYTISAKSGMYVSARFHWHIKYAGDRSCTAHFRVA